MKPIGLLSLFIILCGLMTSCIREDIIPINLKNTEPKLVVIGFLTPGKTIQVYVGRTQPFGKYPILRSDFKELNATVTLKNETGLEKTLHKGNETVPIYSISQEDFPIESGKSYSIQVNAPNYPVVGATTTVPAQKATWKTITLFPHEVEYNLKGTWDALANESGIDYNVSIIGQSKDNTLRQEDGMIMNLGTSYEVQQDIYFYYNESTLNAVLLTIDKESSEFRRISGLTLEVFYHFKDAYFTDLISGFKGVMPQGGNINGGHGVLGSYLIDSKTIYKPKDAN